MASTKIPSYTEINNAIKKIADIPSRVDDEGYIIADGVSLTKNVYDPKNGDYELHVRDKKNNKWQSFDTEDGADCVERAAKCFVDFYDAKHKSESHKFNCSMQKKKESLSKKSEGINDVRAFIEQTGCLDAIADCLAKMCMSAKETAISNGLHTLQGNIYTAHLNDVLETALISDYSSVEEHITDCISDFVKQEVPPKSN